MQIAMPVFSCNGSENAPIARNVPSGRKYFFQKPSGLLFFSCFFAKSSLFLLCFRIICVEPPRTQPLSEAAPRSRACSRFRLIGDRKPVAGSPSVLTLSRVITVPPLPCLCSKSAGGVPPAQARQARHRKMQRRRRVWLLCSIPGRPAGRAGRARLRACHADA